MSSTHQLGNLLAAGAVSPSALAGSRLWTSEFLSREERDALDDAVLSSRLIKAGTDLIQEGEYTDSLLIVLKGWACRYATTRQGNRQLPALLVPGDVGNLDSLLFERLDYGVQTITQVTVAVLPRERIIALAAQHPGIARTFTWLAMVENTILSKWTLSLGRRTARERLAHLFCELSVRLGGENGNESSFDYPLTQEQLADALGLTAVHVKRTMQELRTAGLVTIEKRRMNLPDLPELRQVAEFDPRYLHIDGPSEAQLTASRDRPVNQEVKMEIVQRDDLLVRETNHRSSNDLQMVVGLLGLQSRRARMPEVRQALSDAGERVAVLARARIALHADRQPSLERALRQVCEALHAQAEPRDILVSMQAEREVHGLSQHQITTLALVVNELATNAIKHAFEDGRSGHIRIMVGTGTDGGVRIIVDDDGLPFRASNNNNNRGGGLGLDLGQRLMASIGGLMISPQPGTKLFELRLPVRNS